ncbi:MAG: hypothetical protein GX640_24920 [Fibrobacter sp.]|nr:hypothetical protein [Fibrobacter sp.]
MTNSEQAIREKAINIFADIFAAGGEAHEVGGQSFDQLQQSGYIDRKITDLTALISEHYYPKEFVEWMLKCGTYSDVPYKTFTLKWNVNIEPGTWQYFTTDELFNYWEENER